MIKLEIKNKTLFLVLAWLLMVGCTSEMDKRVKNVLAISGPNRSELETVLRHYRHEPQKLKAAKFLIANMRYHHSPYSIRSSQQHPLLDSLTNLADSLLYELAVENPDSLQSWKGVELVLKFRVEHGEKVLEQPANVLWKEDYDYRWIKARQLINHIDHVFELRERIEAVRRLSTEDFYEYVLSYRSIPNNPLVDLSDTYSAFMGKYMTDIDRDSIREMVERYNYVVGQCRNFFPSYPYKQAIGYQELFFHGFHDCIPVADYGVSMLKACGIPAAVEFNVCYKQFQGKHYHGAVLDKNKNWLVFTPESSIPAVGNTSYDMARMLNIYRFMFSEQKDAPFFLEREGEYIPRTLDSPFIKDVTSNLTKTVSLTLPYCEAGNNHLAYLAVFNGETSGGIVPVTWGKINRVKRSVTFSSVIPDRYYFPIYYSPFGQSLSFGTPFALDKEGKVVENKIDKQRKSVILHRKYPKKQGLIDKAGMMIGTVVQASNEPEFEFCDTVGIISDTLQPYFQDIYLDMSKGPYCYYRIKTPDKYPHVSLAELQFITDSRYGYSNTVPATPLPILLPEDVLREDMTDVRLMDEPWEQIKKRAEYDGNPQTSPEAYSTVCFMLKKPQLVTKVRMMPLNADNAIVPGNLYELLYWNNGEWKKIESLRADFNYIKAEVPPGTLLWLRNLTAGKEELPFYINSSGEQHFIYE